MRNHSAFNLPQTDTDGVIWSYAIQTERPKKTALSLAPHAKKGGVMG